MDCVRRTSELNATLLAASLGAVALFGAAPARAGANEDALKAVTQGLNQVTFRKYDEAIATLEAAQEKCRRRGCQAANKAQIYMAAAVAYGLRGDMDIARERFEWALAENPTATPDARYMTTALEEAFDQAKGLVDAGNGAQPPRPVGELTPEQKQAIEQASEQLRAKDWEACLQTMIVSTSAAEYAAGKLMLAKCQDQGGLLLEARRDAEGALELANKEGDEKVIAEIKEYLEQLDIETPKIRLKIQKGIRNAVVKIDNTEIPAAKVKEPIPHNPGTAIVEVTGSRGGQPYKFRQEIQFQRREAIDLAVRSDVTPYQACLNNARTLSEKEECDRIFNVKRGLNVRGALEVSSYNDNDNVDVLSPSLGVAAIQPTQGWNIGGSVIVDVVTTASADIVATASRRWDEVRFGASLGGGYKLGPVTAGLNASVSVEPDYIGRSVGASASAELGDKMVTPYLGYDFGFDILGRADTEFEVFHRNLYQHTVSAGTSIVFDAETIGVVAATAQFELGDGSKPYRHVPMFAQELVDDIPVGASADLVSAARLDVFPLEQLPENRQRYALLLRAAHRFETVTIRGSERGYIDSWGQKASSTDLRLYWDFVNASSKPGEQQFPMLTLSPHVRFHIQGPVDFWQRTYVAFQTATGFAIPKLRTGDRELGPMYAATVGLGLKARVHEMVSLGTQLDGIYTRFLDHLYLFDRWGLFTASVLEVEVD